MNYFIPNGVDPTAYMLAQEQMYGLNKRRDVLRRIIGEVDKELKETIEEARKLLSEYPTLSLQARKYESKSRDRKNTVGKIIDFARPRPRVGGFEIVADGTIPLADVMYEFKEKPVAKSSTSVMQAGVCQKCGCKLDGKIESVKPGCTCRCHFEGTNAR